MKDKIMKMLMDKKKAGKELSENEKNAKLKIVGDLKKLAEDAMANDIKGMKKVTVAAPTEEGLKEGLEKAEEIVSEQPEMEDSDDLEDAEEAEDELEDEDLSLEDIEAKIAELLQKKEAMKKV